MKFVIATQEMNYLLNKCANIVPTKVTVPILANLLVEAYNGVLTITATDLIVSIRCFTETQILEEGGATLPARRFAQLIREITSANVQIEVKENMIAEITADDSKFRLHGMKKDEFPALPELSGAMKFSVKQAALKEVLSQTAFAVSREDNRYVLTGISLAINQGRATFIGTDGRRMARSYLDIDFDKDYSGKCIIPIKAVEEVIKNLQEEDDIAIYLLSDKIAFETANSTLITKLLSGDYPEIGRVIPKELSHIIPLHREELISILRQVALFTDEENHVVRFIFENGELRLLANNKEVGDGKVSMPANYRGPRLEIAFNSNFFLDALRHSKKEAVLMGLVDPFNPGIISDDEISTTSVDDANPLFVVMPMRLNEG